MEPDGFIDTILKLLTIIGILWGILATWDKGSETLLKVWAWACSVSLSLNKKKTTVVNKLIQIIDSLVARKKAPPPVPIHVFDTIPLALHDGYTALRHRQNAYYYSQG
jgi:hypothetical protein